LHNQYRTRLDLYCSLVFVSAVLAVGGPLLLLTGHRHPGAAALTFGLFVALTFVCYVAAVTAARGYVGVLSAIDDAVGDAHRR
jgi:hypothetical protein